jgi:hypothetical protein
VRLIGDTSKCIVYEANLRCKNYNLGRIYASFREDSLEIEFTKACSGKLVGYVQDHGVPKSGDLKNI